MSNRQLKYYDKLRKREINESMNLSNRNITNQNGLINNMEERNLLSYIIPYPITRMVTLYSYPDIIMADTLKHKYICETDQSSIPDSIFNSSNFDSSELSNKSWINMKYVDNIYNDGPKLFSVLDGIIANWPSKQLVVTRFNHRYGVDLITSFLQLMTQNKRTPYELYEIFHVSCTDEYETSVNILHKFNYSESSVLITNIVPFIPLKGVSVIHIVDSYSFLNIQTIINKVHKRHLNTLNSDIVIYSHLATHPLEKSSDEVLHEQLATHIIDANRIYTGLISMSDKLVFDISQGLVVKCQ
jgi:hypothetical protein